MVNRRTSALLLGLTVLVLCQHLQLSRADADDEDYDEHDEHDEHDDAGQSSEMRATAGPGDGDDDDGDAGDSDSNDTDDLAANGPDESAGDVQNEFDFASLFGAGAGAGLIGQAGGEASEPPLEAPQAGNQGQEYVQTGATATEQRPVQSRASFGGLDLAHGLRNRLSPVRLFSGFYYERQYPKISDYLEKHEPSDGLDANFRAANEWLSAELATGVRLFRNRATVEALEQLVALGTIGRQCDWFGYMVNWRNNRATEGRALRPPSELEPNPSRVVSMVHGALLSHAVHCLPTYMETFRSIYNSMDRRVVSRVERTMGEAVVSLARARMALAFMLSRQPGAPFDPVRLIYRIKSLRDMSAPARLFYEATREAARDEAGQLNFVLDQSSGFYAMDSAKIRALVRQHLVAPCEQFIGALGPAVFIPAKFDSRLIEREDRFGWASDIRDLFVRSWLNFRLCELLVLKERAFVEDKVLAFVRTLREPVGL